MSLPGLEPGASGLGGSRSIQLSYRDIYDFLACGDNFASRYMARRKARKVNPEETRKYCRASPKPSDIIAENIEISRFSDTNERGMGVKRGVQFFNYCRVIIHKQIFKW